MTEIPHSMRLQDEAVERALEAFYAREYRSYRTRRIIRAIVWWAAVIGCLVGTLAVLILGA